MCILSQGMIAIPLLERSNRRGRLQHLAASAQIHFGFNASMSSLSQATRHTSKLRLTSESYLDVPHKFNQDSFLVLGGE